MLEKSINIDDVYEETIFCWECPHCGVINKMIEEPQWDIIDVFECKNCNKIILFEKDE